MKLHISEGNSKLGKIPNISLPPVVTCRKKVPCAKDCYAHKAFRLWPTVTRAWTENLEFLQENRAPMYFDRVERWLWEHRVSHFRWHVSGDCPDRDYVSGVFQIARLFPDIKFMMFTKRWDLLPIDEDIPNNLSIILSMWPGLPNPKKLTLPRAWLSTDKRLPKFYFKCPGRCDECYKCWDLVKLGYDVVFDKH